MMQGALKLEAVFNEIARTRMEGVPVLNPALRVEAVGFRSWEGRWVGVLVTPWMINLVLLPGEGEPLVPLALGEKMTWLFPSGSYEFMGLNEPMLGVCHVCSLISPVTEFTSHDEVLAIAQEILTALFIEGRDDLPASSREARMTNPLAGRNEMSRRDFLRIPLMGGQ